MNKLDLEHTTKIGPPYQKKKGETWQPVACKCGHVCMDQASSSMNCQCEKKQGR